jgi:hypothetical protein
MTGRERERDLFRARAALKDAVGASAPPPFERVLGRVRRERASATAGERGSSLARTGARTALRRAAPWLATAAAAAVALGVAWQRGTDAPAVTEEPRSIVACYDDAPSLVVEATAYATDRAIASAEDHYAACLVATPRTAATTDSCGPK